MFATIALKTRFLTIRSPALFTQPGGMGERYITTPIPIRSISASMQDEINGSGKVFKKEGSW